MYQKLIEKIKNGYIPPKKNVREYFVYYYHTHHQNSVHIENSDSEIINFLKNRHILVTGVTGFLGRLFVEKLLRSCESISKIYVIVRPKKDKNFEERLNTLFDDEIFGNLREILPHFKDKIVAIQGDISKAKLGISNDDLKILNENIEIVIHSAATTNFDEALRKAVDINLRGTEELLKLSKKFRKLVSFVHISTAYSNCLQKEVREKIYEPYMPLEELYDILSKNDDGNLLKMKSDILKKAPNTYTFTKQLAEYVVSKCSKGIPVCIVRPSIVLGTYREPIKGWITSIFSPMGMQAGGGVGIIRTMRVGRLNNIADFVPADYVVNCCIAACYETFLNGKASEVKVYNCVTGSRNPVTWAYFINFFQMSKVLGTLKSMWYPKGIMIENYFLHIICEVFLHFLPGLIYDTIQILLLKKPILLKAYKKIFKYQKLVLFFTMYQWNFEDINTQKLWENLSQSDKNNFEFDPKKIDWYNYFLMSTFGIRFYLMKDPLNTLENGWKRYDRLKMYNSIFLICLTLMLVCLLFKICY